MIRMHIQSSITNTVAEIHPHGDTQFVVPGRHYEYEVIVRPRKRRTAKANRPEPTHSDFPTLPRWN